MEGKEQLSDSGVELNRSPCWPHGGSPIHPQPANGEVHDCQATQNAAQSSTLDGEKGVEWADAADLARARAKAGHQDGTKGLPSEGWCLLHWLRWRSKPHVLTVFGLLRPPSRPLDEQFRSWAGSPEGKLVAGLATVILIISVVILVRWLVWRGDGEPSSPSSLSGHGATLRHDASISLPQMWENSQTLDQGAYSSAGGSTQGASASLEWARKPHLSPIGQNEPFTWENVSQHSGGYGDSGKESKLASLSHGLLGFSDGVPLSPEEPSSDVSAAQGTYSDVLTARGSIALSANSGSASSWPVSSLPGRAHQTADAAEGGETHPAPNNQEGELPRQQLRDSIWLGTMERMGNSETIGFQLPGRESAEPFRAPFPSSVLPAGTTQEVSNDHHFDLIDGISVTLSRGFHNANSWQELSGRNGPDKPSSLGGTPIAFAEPTPIARGAQAPEEGSRLAPSGKQTEVPLRAGDSTQAVGAAPSIGGTSRTTLSPIYITQPGDSAFSVARRLWGNPARWNAIVNANPGVFPTPESLERIPPGTPLRIPEF